MSRFDPAAPVIVEQPAVVREDTFRAETVINELIKLDRRHTMDAFERGDLFSEFVEGDYQHADHCQTLPEFLKKRGFELSPATIKSDIKNARYAKKLGIDRAALLRARVTKVKEIFKLDPEATFVDGATNEETSMSVVIADLIQRAPELSLAEIKAVVKQFNTADDEDNELVKDTVHYTRLQKEVVDLAVDRMTKFSGVQKDEVTGEEKEISRGTAIERICGNFLADPNFEVEEGEAGTFADSAEDEPTTCNIPQANVGSYVDIDGVRYFKDEDGKLYEVAD